MRGTLAACPCPVAPCAARIGKLARLDICLLYTAVEDLLKNNKTCPEESIYQIGTMGESVPPDTLFSIVNEFYEEFERRFGSHIHILDWALHLEDVYKRQM